MTVYVLARRDLGHHRRSDASTPCPGFDDPIGALSFSRDPGRLDVSH